MLNTNLDYLREENKVLHDKLENELNNHVQIIDAKNGMKTIQIKKNNKTQFLHSVYNPKAETELFVKKVIEEKKENVPIIFIGIGLGYHLQPILEELNPPWISFAEFDLSILKISLETTNLRRINSIIKIKNIHFIESEEDYLSAILDNVKDINHLPHIIVLPSYERIFREEVDFYLNKFKFYFQERRREIVNTVSFQKRWTYNSMKNFPLVLRTPNILTDISKDHFKNKPAVLVAAGPSLNEEFQNLRKIKENRSAYIFSVGSAINALIEQNIYPDAAFTYDPTNKNQFVFQKIKENIIDIPLIFGSTVGFETIENYPGKMAHFITDQDYISRNTVQHNTFKKIEGVVDSPSIAIMTLQVLNLLGFNPIILVGQNFSYKNNARYASGVSNVFAEVNLDDKEVEEAIEVESVTGRNVLTNNVFLRMKENMEKLLLSMKERTVYNTTKNGARIKYTIYKELDEVSALLPKNSISSNWLHNQKPNYDMDYINEKWAQIIHEFKTFEENVRYVEKIINRIEEYINTRKINKVSKLYILLDEKVEIITQTMFYKVFISSMCRYEYDIVSKEVLAVRYSSDPINKGKVIIKNYRRLLSEWMVSFALINGDILKIYKEIKNLTNK